MRDRAGFLAALSDSLTEMCLFYAVGGLLVAGRRWGVHLFWLLLWAALCTVFFALLLRRGRSVPMLTAVTGTLGLAGFGLFTLFSVTPLGFGYGFVLAIGAGMAVGVPLYFTLHRPRILAQVTQVDVLIVALLFFLLAREALGLDAGTLGLTAAVLLLDVAAAAGLRMDEDGTGASRGTYKAALTAFCAALLLAAAVWLVSLVFSHSGSVTGGFFRGIGALLAALGAGIESAMGRLVRLLAREEHFEAVELTGELPSLAGAELAAETAALPVNTTMLGLILCLVLATAMTAVALLFRRRRLRRAGETILLSDPERGVRRTGGTAGILLARLRAALAFRRAAFLYRNTPAGL